MGEKKYLSLLDHPDVRRWYENVARGSLATADLYLRRIGQVCSHLDVRPEELVKWDEDRIYNTVLDLVSWMERKGKAGSYIESVVKVVKSWLAHNGIVLKRKIKIKGARDTPRLRNERTPTQDELKKILLACDRKSRAICALMAFSGLRVEVLGDYKGTDGLRVKDLPEMRVENGAVTFERIPTMVVVRKELSKARHQYFTFLGEEGCQYLKDYLEERMRSGEVITGESPIITPKKSKKPFIRTINISDAMRIPMRKAGFPWRPYVLRAYFDTQLMLAESKRLIIRDYRQFFMGHKGDIEARYTTNKCRLPSDVVEDMRSSYAKCTQFLETMRPKISEDEVAVAFRRQLMLVVGFKSEELDKMDIASMTDDEVYEAIRQKLVGMMVNNGARQRVIPIEEVERYIAQGWEYVDTLPNNKAIMRIPF